MLLDTHIWIRYVNNPVGNQSLPKSLITKIEQASELFIASISCWEFTQLVKRGRILIDEPELQWIDLANHTKNIRILPLTKEIAVMAEKLPNHHKDPADRFIIATSMHYHLPLVSLDTVFPVYQEISHLLINR